MIRRFRHRFWVCVTVGLAGAMAGAFGRLDLLLLVLPCWWVVAFSLIEGWWPVPTLVTYAMSTPQAVEGDEVEVVVTVQTDRSLPWIGLQLGLEGGLSSTARTAVATSAGAGAGSTTSTLSFSAATWGARSPRSLQVTTRDRFGLTQADATIDIGERILIHPRTERIDRLVALARTRMAVGEHLSRRRGQGIELAEVRYARSGDAARMVHPRLSARRGSLMVLERHPEQASDVVILVDAAQDVGHGLDSSLRWTIQAALALNLRHQRAMDRVGLIDWGGTIRWLDPGLGRQAGHRIVQSLLRSTVVQRSGTGDLDQGVTTGELPLGRLPPGCVVFAVSLGASDALNRDLARIRRRGHQVVVIRPVSGELRGPEPSARVARILAELRRRELTRSGILVVAWNPDDPLDRALTVAEETMRRNRTVASRR